VQDPGKTLYLDLIIRGCHFFQGAILLDRCRHNIYLIPDMNRSITTTLRVFIPFALGYFLSYLFRVVNAVIAPDLVADLGIGPSALTAVMPWRATRLDFPSCWGLRFCALCGSSSLPSGSEVEGIITLVGVPLVGTRKTVSYSLIRAGTRPAPTAGWEKTSANSNQPKHTTISMLFMQQGV
jgi:hypothetical protein